MSRGGARKGSGRKPLPPDTKRVTLCINVAPETRAIIDRLREQGYNVGRIADDLLQEFARQYLED